MGKNKCEICQKTISLDGLIEYGGKQLCSNCIRNIQDIQEPKRANFFRRNWYKILSIGLILFAVFMAVAY